MMCCPFGWPTWTSPSPPAVVDALRRRAAHGVYGYALAPDSLKEAIVERCAARYGWQVQREWIVFLPGVVPGLTLGAMAFAAPGEAVLTIVPAYPPFLEVPPARGRELITVPAAPAEGRWELPLEAMEAAVTAGTRVLLFCHPHNPLGTGVARGRGGGGAGVLPPPPPGARVRRDPLRPRARRPGPRARRLAAGGRRAHRDAHVPQQDLQPARPRLRLGRGAGRRRCASASRRRPTATCRCPAASP